MVLTLIFEVFLGINTWSGLCWVGDPFFYSLWILGKCGGYGVLGRECCACGLVVERNEDWQGVKAQDGCGKEKEGSCWHL